MVKRRKRIEKEREHETEGTLVLSRMIIMREGCWEERLQSEEYGKEKGSRRVGEEMQKGREGEE